MSLSLLKPKETNVTQADLIESGYFHGLVLIYKAERYWCTKHKLNNIKWLLKDAACCLYSAYQEFC